MAIINSMWLKGSKKRLGGTVIYQAMGQTRQRELAAEVSNPRTESQMNQRVKWANLVNFYRANRSWMKYAYETRKASQSEYNKFMSLNVPLSRIYLTKALANAGGCIVDTYIMTQGSLPSIEFVPTDNGYVHSNIALGNLALGPSTTVSEFSAAALEYNPAIRQGDQLSFVRMTQMTNASTGVPYVIVREYEVIIDTSNLGLLGDYLPLDLITIWGGDMKYLAVGINSGKSGGFLMILSRTISGKTYVSSQRIYPVAMDTFIEAYSSSSALQAAIESYGVTEDAFLSSTYAAEDNQAPTSLAMLYMRYSPTDAVFVPGDRALIPTLGAEEIFNFFFNSAPAAVPASIVLETSVGQISLENLSKVNKTVSGETPDDFLDKTNVVIFAAKVTVDNLEFRIEFAIRNEDSQGGLE